jgi:hypothetical protein
MYSDDWLRQGYTSDEQTQVSDYVFYRLWYDQAGTEIGATVDFEIDNDFHYEMPLSEWQKFLKVVLQIDESDDVTSALSDYFLKKQGLFDFEADLKIHSIGYQKIAFY